MPDSSPVVVRVVIVDDHPIVRAGLRATLASEPSVTVVGDVGSGSEGVALARQSHPDVVLMDLHLGGDLDGAVATRLLSELADPPRVLVLTAYESEADILRAIEAGATGYLLKDADPADLVAAIRTAAAGETVLAPAVAGRLMSRVRAPQRALTQRETQILDMVSHGSANAAVAKALFITEATVKSHLVQVFAKLGVDNRTAAVAEGRRRGLIG